MRKLRKIFLILCFLCISCVLIQTINLKLQTQGLPLTSLIRRYVTEDFSSQLERLFSRFDNNVNQHSNVKLLTTSISSHLDIESQLPSELVLFPSISSLTVSQPESILPTNPSTDDGRLPISFDGSHESSSPSKLPKTSSTDNESSQTLNDSRQKFSPLSNSSSSPKAYTSSIIQSIGKTFSSTVFQTGDFSSPMLQTMDIHSSRVQSNVMENETNSKQPTFLRITIFRGETTKEMLPLNYNNKTNLLHDHSSSRCRNRFSWTDILHTCRDFVHWEDRNLDPKLRSNVTESVVVLSVGNSAGSLSQIKIKTFDHHGMEKLSGGDYWRVALTGGKSLRMNIEMQDDEDGNYTGVFVVPYPGEYDLNVFLEYSRCEGLTDPPQDWFSKGSIQGKFQPEGVLGQIDNFLNDPIKQIHFVVLNHSSANFVQNTSDSADTNKAISTNCGFWQAGEYQSLHHQTQPLMTTLENLKTKNLSTLFIHGDSLGYRFYESLLEHSICKTIFKKCAYTYTWTYKHFSPRDYKADIYNFTGADFNETKFLSDIEIDLVRDDMRTNSSVFVVNFGIHLVSSIQMNRLFNLFQRFLKMLIQLKLELGVEQFPLVIWKSTTPTVFENWKVQNQTSLRFLTNQRIQVWNSYTIEEAGKAKIPVLDVYDVAKANPFGNKDYVHYDNEVFKVVENELAEFIAKNSYGNKTVAA